MQRRVAEAQAIEPLVSMLEAPGTSNEDSQRCQAACSCLATLSVDNPPIQLATAQAGALPLLIQLLQHERNKTRENAALAIAMLAAAHENKRLIAQAAGRRL